MTMLSSCARSFSRSVARRAYTTHSQLPEEHKMVYEMCRKFADEELAPNAGAWDQKHEFPREAVSHLVGSARQCLCRSIVSHVHGCRPTWV